MKIETIIVNSPTSSRIQKGARITWPLDVLWVFVRRLKIHDY